LEATAFEAGTSDGGNGSLELASAAVEGFVGVSFLGVSLLFKGLAA